MTTKEKRCRTCGEVKQANAFYKLTKSEDGLHPECKSCCKVNRALENVRKRDRKSKISRRQIYRCQQLGIETDTTITLAGIFKRDRGICGWCNQWVKPRYASIDHIIPVSKGGTHTQGNVQLVHYKCNLRKGHKLDE